MRKLVTLESLNREFNTGGDLLQFSCSIAAEPGMLVDLIGFAIMRRLPWRCLPQGCQRLPPEGLGRGPNGAVAAAGCSVSSLPVQGQEREWWTYSGPPPL